MLINLHVTQVTRPLPRQGENKRGGTLLLRAGHHRGVIYFMIVIMTLLRRRGAGLGWGWRSRASDPPAARPSSRPAPTVSSGIIFHTTITLSRGLARARSGSLGLARAH